VLVRWFATPEQVTFAQRNVAELGSLVTPNAKAQAVTTGCAVKIGAAVSALIGLSFAFGFALMLAEEVHLVAGAIAALVGGLGALLGSVGFANALTVMAYERALRSATTTPRLGAVSSGGVAAIPSAGGTTDER